MSDKYDGITIGDYLTENAIENTGVVKSDSFNILYSTKLRLDKDAQDAGVRNTGVDDISNVYEVVNNTLNEIQDSVATRSPEDEAYYNNKFLNMQRKEALHFTAQTGLQEKTVGIEIPHQTGYTPDTSYDARISTVTGIEYNSDGTSLYAGNDGSGPVVKRFNLSTPYDISTAVLDTILRPNSFNSIRGMSLSDDNKYMYFITSNGRLYVNSWDPPVMGSTASVNISDVLWGTPKSVEVIDSNHIIFGVTGVSKIVHFDDIITLANPTVISESSIFPLDNASGISKEGDRYSVTYDDSVISFDMTGVDFDNMLNRRFEGHFPSTSTYSPLSVSNGRLSLLTTNNVISEYDDLQFQPSLFYLTDVFVRFSQDALIDGAVKVSVSLDKINTPFAGTDDVNNWTKIEGGEHLNEVDNKIVKIDIANTDETTGHTIGLIGTSLIRDSGVPVSHNSSVGQVASYDLGDNKHSCHPEEMIKLLFRAESIGTTGLECAVDIGLSGYFAEYKG